jgi:Fasciclin domain
VQFAGSAGEDGPRAPAVSPAAGQRVQPAADHVAGEVLLGDADRATRPTLAEVMQVRQQDVAQHGFHGQDGEHPVEHGLCGRFVEPVESARRRTSPAFAKITQATLNQVLADQQALTNVLRYHVVGQRTGPAELAAGTLTTLQGGTIRTAKDGETYTANDARILCGNIQTRNATVYLIDTVLMPKS